MDTSFHAEGWPARLTAQQIMEELISQRVESWKAKQEKVPDPEVAAKIIAMCWDYDSLPLSGPGCLMCDKNGEYTYVTYDSVSRGALPADLQQRIDVLDRWLRDSKNSTVLRELDKMMEKKMDDECFYEFLDGGSPQRVDFHGKIKILAKYRLIETALNAVDVSPTNPHHSCFRFAITNINAFGNVEMEWRYLSWDCTELEFLTCLTEGLRPAFNPDTEIPRLLRHLEAVLEPEDAAKEAEEYSKELQSEQPVMNEPEWAYFLCSPGEGTTPLEENRTWVSLRRKPNDFKFMKRLSREQSKWPIIVRSEQLRHYKRCLRVHQLQVRQLNHAREAEKNQPRGVLDKDGKPHILGN